MSKKFTLTLPPPLNQTYRYGKHGYYKIQKAHDWQEEAGWMMKTQIPLEGPVFVHMKMFLNRDRDIDSSIKLALDVLAKAGVYVNDKQVEHLVVEKFKDKDNPRLEVVVGELKK